MAYPISVLFLGTTSGGGPTETRNCSSLVFNPFGDEQLWMVDCAEGTNRQFAAQPYYGGDPRRAKVTSVRRIFITHMHADHTMGIVTLLRNVLGIPRPPAHLSSTTQPDLPPPNASRPRVEVYGPRGIRRMIRTLFWLTHTHSEFAYAAHELLFPGEEPSVSADTIEGSEGPDMLDKRHESECIGQDIRCDAQGFWRRIVEDAATRNHPGWLVDAGPIEHRDPCIGYVFRETPRLPFTPLEPIPRKLVILGDTYDPSPMLPLIDSDPDFADPASPHAGENVPVSLLIHEATDAYMPPTVDAQQRSGRNRTAASVHAKALERGHSTPAMAGAFARRIGAQALVLNHIGARFPAPAHGGHGHQASFRANCVREIERQAAHGLRTGDVHGFGMAPPGGGRGHAHADARVQAAYDFLQVLVHPNEPRGDVQAARRAEAEARGLRGSGRDKGKGRERAREVDGPVSGEAAEAELEAEGIVFLGRSSDGRGRAAVAVEARTTVYGREREGHGDERKRGPNDSWGSRDGQGGRSGRGHGHESDHHRDRDGGRGGYSRGEDKRARRER